MSAKRGANEDLVRPILDGQLEPLHHAVKHREIGVSMCSALRSVGPFGLPPGAAPAGSAPGAALAALSRARIDRRRFAQGLGAAAAVFAPAPFAIASGNARVVIIGGGPAGATVAGEVKKAAPKLSVTLVEPLIEYTSCFFSNHYIGGLRTLTSLTHRYSGFNALGVEFVHKAASAIDLEKRLVLLATGQKLEFDRLVVAPGIDFKFGAIERYDEKAAEIMPHAWKSGQQTRLLRRKLEAMRDGGVVVIAPPKLPYRCPPGPYERVCVIANYLKTAKPRSKIVVLDAKMTYSKQPAFEEAYKKYYDGMIEVHLTNDIDDQSVSRVDLRTGEIETRAGLNIKADVANIIPQQTAGRIALAAGLADGDWCPVDPETFMSAKAKGVYVVGDAAIAADMPKSAFAASSQARVVAADIVADLMFTDRAPARYHNTCWSFLAPGDSVKIGADYTPGEWKGHAGLVPSGPFVSAPGEPAELRKENYEASLAWYTTLTNEMFQKMAKR